MAQRLVIDLDRCRGCGRCEAECAYPYHPDNDGVARLMELASQEVLCRRCEVRPCVEACPNRALEPDERGVLRRLTMRCTGCLSCSVACPFGTVLPAAFEFRTSMCDFCAGRREPLCVESCPHGALAWREVPEEVQEPGLFLVGQHLAVRASVWLKQEASAS